MDYDESDRFAELIIKTLMKLCTTLLSTHKVIQRLFHSSFHWSFTSQNTDALWESKGMVVELVELSDPFTNHFNISP
jgi:hypothetical protein